MTEQPVVQPAEAKPAELPSRLAAAARRARYAILWERVWPPLATLATAAGLFLALSWLGLWLWLPPLGRAAGLVLFGALALWAAFPFWFLRPPGFADALHRLDRVSGLRHRPATTLADRLAVNAQDPYALALWNAHVARSLQNANALRAGAPAPRVSVRDPYAVRGLVLIAAIATFFAAGGERWHRVAAAFDWRGVVVPANFRVDAWVAPPAYTGRPPIILPGIHPGETGTAAAQAEGLIGVPVNSTLVVRATGKVKLDLSTTGGLVPAEEEGHPPAGAEEHRFTITATGAATLRGAGETLVWPLNAIPDRPPTIALIKDPEQQSRGSLLLSYRLEDDYGVAEAQATFARKDNTSGHPGAQTARPLFGPPDFALVLPQARTKNGTGQTIKDLTDHPWAGAEVTMTLVARDDAGNEGKSEPFDFRLPERVFTKPLARALIEQRRNLALDANARPLVGAALDALALAPERFTKEAGIYLGLRSVYWSLERAKSDDDLREVVKRLWQMAVGIEDGDISNAEEALRNAENALQQALDRGASDAELKALMEQLRAAMDRFLQAMAEQLKNNRELARPLSPNTRVLSSRDLQNMLDRLETLARSGAKDAARQLLQQLQEMMENLQAGVPDMNEGDEDMMSALDELGDMIHQQQQLRDRTFREGQQQREQRQRGTQQQPNGNSLGNLQQNQQALRDRLNKLLEDLKNRGFGQNDQNQQGQGAPGQGQAQGQGEEQLDQLGRAGEAMGDAAGNLGEGDPDSAVDSQGRALDALRKGAQGLAQSMQQQMGRGPGPGRPGRFGQSRAQQDTDPLGRPLRGREYGDDATVKVPGEIDVQRARRIIEELRKRFGDFARPQEELDYIERLLKNY